MNPLQRYCNDGKNLIVIYDIEALASYFSIMMMDVDNPDDIYKYECYYTEDGHEVNELVNMIKFLKYNVGLMIGYNNFHYDYPVIEAILSMEDVIKTSSVKTILNLIYKSSQTIISTEAKKKIKTSECIIPQIDLMVLNNWNKDNRWVSLKQLEFVMDFDNVQDMPYSHTHIMKNKRQASRILAYNLNDVKATHQLYLQCVKENLFGLRIQLEEQFQDEFISSPEPEIGEVIFSRMMAQEMGISTYELSQLRTERDVIKVGEQVLLPYIKFESKEFQTLLEVYKKQEINTLKGFFDKITRSNPAYDLIKKISREDLIVEGKNWGRNKNTGNPEDEEHVKFLNVYFKGHTYAYGNGGIHSDMQSKTYKANKDYMILDLDVTSYYPNLAIQNGFKPEHLGEAFKKVYNNIFVTRQNYAKGTPANYILKIILNSVYGKSNSKFSFLYDSLMTSQICINGQLLITMLIEKMVLKLNAECIMANTDGATFYIKRKDYEKAKEIVKEWESITNLQLEEAHYQEQYFRDVNNYIWIPVDKNAKPKLKGCFEYFAKKELKDFHRNFSQRIVAEACVKQIVDKIPFKETIDRCKDMSKFYMGIKCKKTHRMFTREWDPQQAKFVDTNLSKFTRFFAAHPSYSKLSLWKQLEDVEKIPKDRKIANQHSIFDELPPEEDPIIMVERYSQILKDRNIIIANKIGKDELQKIDYDYYYKECKKILDLIPQ